MSNADRIDETSPDMKVELLARLKSVVPEAFPDGQLDLTRIAELAGDAVQCANSSAMIGCAIRWVLTPLGGKSLRANS
jgi:hypothetical protein